MRILRALLPLAAVALAFWPGFAAAEEAACAADANCQCSEPFQMNGFTTPTADHYDPNDSTVKACSGESNNGGVIARNSGGSAPLVGTNASVLGALPTGSTVQRYLYPGPNHTGIYEFDHRMGAAPLARVGIRWYVLYSSATVGGVEYEWALKSDPTQCQNSAKYFSLWYGNFFNTTEWDFKDGANSYPTIYAWTGFTPSLICCYGYTSPAYPNLASVPALANQTVTGHWYRYEVYLRNNTGAPGTIFQAWRQDVTANTARTLIVDTSVACNGCNANGSNPNDPDDWGQSGSTTTLTPPGALFMVQVNLFRNPGSAGHCNGFRAYSHLAVWAWNTDAGQLVPVASEIESGSAPPPPGLALFLRLAFLGTLIGAGALLLRARGAALARR